MIACHARRGARLMVGHPWRTVVYANVSPSFYQPRTLNRYVPTGVAAV